MFFCYILVCQLFLGILQRILFFEGLLLLVGYDIKLQRIHILKIIKSIGWNMYQIIQFKYKFGWLGRQDVVKLTYLRLIQSLKQLRACERAIELGCELQCCRHFWSRLALVLIFWAELLTNHLNLIHLSNIAQIKFLTKLIYSLELNILILRHRITKCFFLLLVANQYLLLISYQPLQLLQLKLLLLFELL